jgi:hypothetical protein
VNTSLREPETVKVYGVNRYVDAGDPRVMHERDAIYRLEEQPAWVTRSPKNRNEVILGPTVGLRKPEYAPEPMPGIFPSEPVALLGTECTRVEPKGTSTLEFLSI